MVGLSAQQLLQKRMDTTANNLANLTTSGFKVEHVVSRALSEKPAAAADSPQDISFADAWTLQRDFSTGPLEQTGNPLDFALEGNGFFEVQTQGGTAYTRDGRFGLNDAGEVVTRNGDPVMGEGGPITVNATGGPLSVSREGSISQYGVILGKLKTVQFQTPGALERMGSNLWKATDEQPQPATDVRIAAGMVEGSNVNAVSEMVRMIEVQRSYEASQKAIQSHDQTLQRLVNDIARM